MKINFPYYLSIYQQVGTRRFAKRFVAKLRKEVRSLWYSYFSPSIPKSVMRAGVGCELERVKSLRYGESNNGLFLSLAEMGKIAQLVRMYYQDDLNQLLTEANQICDGKWQVLHRPFRLRENYGWHIDPFQNFQWPLVYAERIDIFSERRLGDVWPVWELNRFQHLPILGIAYRLTGDSKYIHGIVDHIRSWREQNPYLIGINWRDGLQLATRIISWLLTLSLIYDAPELSDKDLRLILEGLFLHGYELRRILTPEFEVRNNHVIGEAAGLVVLSCLLPDLCRGTNWFKVGLDTLCKAAPSQTYLDGVNFEGSTEYHLFVLEFLLLTVVILRSQRVEAPAELEALIKSMLEFEAHIIRADGSAPQFGDSCEGRAFRLGLYDNQRHRVALAIGGVLYRDSKLRAAASQFPFDAFWILGSKGFESFSSLKPEDRSIGSRAFQEVGWYIMRTGLGKDLIQIMVDCGPIGMGLNGHGGHGHNDLLSFELSVGSRPIVVDSGTFTYLGNQGKRNFFRSALAHNALILDDKDPSILGCGPYLIRQQAQPQNVVWGEDNTRVYFRGEHNGYIHWPGNPVVRRTVVLVPARSGRQNSEAFPNLSFDGVEPIGIVFVHDEVLGIGSRLVRVQYSFASGCCVKKLSLEGLSGAAINAKGLAVGLLLLTDRSGIFLEVGDVELSQYYGQLMKVGGVVIQSKSSLVLPVEILQAFVLFRCSTISSENSLFLEVHRHRFEQAKEELKQLWRQLIPEASKI